MENAKTLNDSVEKVTLSGNELIIGLDGRNIKIPLSALSEFLGIQGPSGIGGVVPDESFVPEMGSPENRSIYFAGPGTYVGFGGIELEAPLNVISWNGSMAAVKPVPIVVPQPDLSGLATKEELSIRPTASDIGIETLPAGVNIFPFVSPPNYNDTAVWGVGGIRENGTISTGATSFRYTLELIPVYAGDYATNIWLSGTQARIIIYNENKVIIDVLNANKGNQAGTSFYDFSVHQKGFIRLSVPLEEAPYNRSFSPKSTIVIPTTSVFATPALVGEAKAEAVAEANVSTNEVLAKLGLGPIPAGTDMFTTLKTSSPEDIGVWGRGFLNSTGGVSGDATYYHTVQYIPVYAGTYQLRTYLTGSARTLVYDKDFNVIEAVMTIEVAPYRKIIVIPQNGRYIRISNRFTMLYAEELELIAVEDIYKPQSGVTSSEVKSVIRDTVRLRHSFKTRTPIVTFISDDGHKNELNWYIPIMRSKGVLSTLAIITSRMLARTSQSLHPEEVVELYKEGFDIAGHTHLHLEMATQMTLEEVNADLAKNKLILNSLGIDCPMFVAPKGSRNAAVDAIVRGYFKCDFISSAPDRVLPYANIPPIQTYTINRVSFDAVANGVSTLAKCKEAIDEAIAVGGWVVFTTHPNYGEYLLENNPDGYLQRRQDLIDLIDYAQGLSVPILTAKAAFEYYKNLEEIGNRTDVNHYALGMDGTETGGFFD